MLTALLLFMCGFCLGHLIFDETATTEIRVADAVLGAVTAALAIAYNL